MVYKYAGHKLSKRASESTSSLYFVFFPYRYFGCGLIAPECIEGMKILDLGSGAGYDCYILSKLVGEQGHVTGIDMTEGQLEVARKYQQFHADKFGFSKPNTDFVKGYIENLGAAGLTDKQFDLIM